MLWVWVLDNMIKSLDFFFNSGKAIMGFKQRRVVTQFPFGKITPTAV